MKDKIIFFIIGCLVGAIITTGAYLIYTNNKDNTCISENASNGKPPSMPNDNGGEPPEKPSNN